MENGEFQKLVIKKFKENDGFQESAMKFQELVMKKFEENDKFQESTMKFQELVMKKFEENDKFQESTMKFQESAMKFQELVMKKFKENDKFQELAMKKFETMEQEVRAVKDIILRMENDHGTRIKALFDGYSLNYELAKKLEPRVEELEDTVEQHTIQLEILSSAK